MILNILLLLFISICVFTDLKYRKVFNIVTFPSVILGLGFNLFYFGLNGLLLSFAGVVLGFIILFPFYLLGGFGAGDIKFLMVVGAVKGPLFLSIGALYGIVFAGVYVITFLAIKGKLIPTLKRLLASFIAVIHFKKTEPLRFSPQDSIFFPYTVFLSIGMLTRLFQSVNPF